MDSEEAAASVISSTIMTVSSFFRLIYLPYKTMRTIRVRSAVINLLPIYILIIVYFLLTALVRGYRFAMIGLSAAVINYMASILFFSFLPSKDTFPQRFNAYLRTWTYTLFPTLLWFYSNLMLYVVLPPPRTMSILGRSFSVIYLAYSVSLGVWKMMLIYLSVRFSSRTPVTRVMYYFLLYLVVFAPFWIFLYKLGISRIPFA